MNWSNGKHNLDLKIFEQRIPATTISRGTASQALGRQVDGDLADAVGGIDHLVGACKIPFAPDHIKKFEARSAIGKKRKSPKC